MKFADPLLQRYVDRASAAVTGLPADQLPIFGLLDACQYFSRTDGEDSPRVREALAHLLSPELRPALRSWYQRCGDDMNLAAIKFREYLAKVAGERFG